MHDGQVTIREREGFVEAEDVGDRSQYEQFIVSGYYTIKEKENNYRVGVALMHLGIEIKEKEA